MVVNTHNLNTQDAEARVQDPWSVWWNPVKKQQKAQECTVWLSELTNL